MKVQAHWPSKQLITTRGGIFSHSFVRWKLEIENLWIELRYNPYRLNSTVESISFWRKMHLNFNYVSFFYQWIAYMNHEFKTYSGTKWINEQKQFPKHFNIKGEINRFTTFHYTMFTDIKAKFHKFIPQRYEPFTCACARHIIAWWRTPFK